MATINTNMSANIAANSMVRNERTMTSTMERLSTGLRINSAKDDAAGLAISSKMTSQIRGLDQAVRNANDAISMIQVAEGAMKEVTNMFQRMRELAVQAISDSNTDADRTALNNEYKQLSSEVKRIAENTQWNGTNILDGARTNSVFQIGANASQTIAVNFGDLATNNIKDTDIAPTATSAASTSSAGAIGKIQVTGTVAAGDVITVKIDAGTAGEQYASFELSAEAAADINKGGSAAGLDAAAAKITESTVGGSSSAVTATTAGALTASVEASTGKIVITGATKHASETYTFTMSGAELSRGTQAPVGGTDITKSGTAATALGVLDTAIENVNSTRATLGASMSRLEYAADNLQNVSQNSSAARSRVLDADYASETTELARTQIIQQASTAMLSQANQAQQSVLALLQ
jgi:flagellin